MADALVRFETIDADQLKQIMDGQPPTPPAGWDSGVDGKPPTGGAPAEGRPAFGSPASQH